jgi:hypothetical protein
MTLTVEDGTGKANADAFVSLTDCATYCTNHGLTFIGTDTAKEAAIRRATTYLSQGFSWKGAKLNGRSQALAWPRTDATDGEGDDVDDDEVPAEVVSACCEVAVRELANPGVTSPDVTMTERVRSEAVGPLRTEYAAVPATADAARPVLTLVMDLIGGLLSASSNPLVGSAVRS